MRYSCEPMELSQIKDVLSSIVPRREAWSKHFYLRDVAGRVWSVEVQQVASAQLTIDHLPLFVQPAAWSIMSPLNHNMVTL